MEELYKKPQQEVKGGENSAQAAVRVRILENRYKNLAKREQLAEDNMLRFEQDLNSEVKALKSRVTQTRKHIAQINERIDIISGQMKDAASRHELQEIEAYLRLIEPLEFATRAEMKRLLDDHRQN